jgi:hypothetical protein
VGDPAAAALLPPSAAGDWCGILLSPACSNLH